MMMTIRNKALSSVALGAVLYAWSAPPAQAGNFEGPYVGVQASYGASNYDISDDNPNGGNNTYSHTRGSDDRAMPSIFAGYGAFVRDYYVGGELEYTRNANTYSGWERTGGTQFERKSEHLESFALDGRFGKLLSPDVLMFGRLGAVRGDFTDQLDGTGGIVPYKTTKTLYGARVGFGSEVSLGNGLSLRTDYVYDRYQSFRNTTPSNIKEDYNPSDSLFRLGLAYHFNGGEDLKDASADRFAGGYVGGLLGYGSAGAQDGTATSGHTQIMLPGFQGDLVAGYGIAKGALYLGGEVQAGLSSQEFEDNFPVTGDSQSMKKTYSQTLAARIGYALTNESMLYGKVGLTRAHFKSNLNLPNDGPSRTGKDSQNLLGKVIGMGTELAMGEHYATRLEYTHTAYNNWSYQDSTGSHGFEPSENMVKVGFVYKFN